MSCQGQIHLLKLSVQGNFLELRNFNRKGLITFTGKSYQYSCPTSVNMLICSSLGWAVFIKKKELVAEYGLCFEALWLAEAGAIV